MKTKIALLAIILIGGLTNNSQAQALFTEQVTLTVAEQTASQLKNTMDMEIRRRVMFRKQAWSSVWENSRATPQEIMTALGTNAVKVLAASTVDAGWFTALATTTGKPVSDFIDPKYLAIKAGWTVTPNQNGSVTVVAPTP